MRYGELLTRWARTGQLLIAGFGLVGGCEAVLVGTVCTSFTLVQVHKYRCYTARQMHVCALALLVTRLSPVKLTPV